MERTQDTSFELRQVLEAELAEIGKIRELRKTRSLEVAKGDERNAAAEKSKTAGETPVEKTDAPWVKTVKAAHAANLTGLCFSGGGIRSATFNLGVLQALAELKLLRRFDYLSTVSGGGYIGSWLAAWIARQKSFAAVEQRLGNSRVAQDENKEPQEIRFLRMYSNYLTPKIGGLSADTWAMVAVYARNMLLNLVVVLGVLAALLMVPHVVVQAVNRFQGGPKAAEAVGICALVALAVAYAAMFRNMAFVDGDWIEKWLWTTGPKQIFGFVCVPLMALAFLGALWGWRLRPAMPWLELALGGGAVLAIVWPVAMTAVMLVGGAVGDADKNARPERGSDEWKAKWSRALRYGMLGGFVAGALTGILYGTAAEWIGKWNGEAMLAFGVPAMLVLLFLCSTAHIGIMGIAFREAKREWWARAAGLMLLTGVGWMILFAMALLFPKFVRTGDAGTIWKTVLSWKVLTPAWLATTIGGVISGKSTATGEPGSEGWRDVLAKVAPYVFIAGLLCWIAWTLDAVLSAYGARFESWLWSHGIDDGGFGMPVVLLVGCAVVATFMAWRVDINQFSMHMFYRNRLVRCYLGASNTDRKPNLFTGFCASDDLPLKNLAADPNNNGGVNDGYDGPYPVLNAALNLVKGKDLAWQERKAESFVMAPQYCGYDVWLEQQDSPVAQEESNPTADGTSVKGATAAGTTAETKIVEGKPVEAQLGAGKKGDVKNTEPKLGPLDKYGYRPTIDYAFARPLNGINLGLAMAISGAAVSPSMGFYTTAPVGFLMTVFDVRLGQWLGNPRDPEKWKEPTPKFGLAYLMKELLGGTNDEAGYVYLSDGGHFEDLALYEMVKRRCGLVIVCDAEEDGQYHFAGLGNAIRKCRIDMGVDIQLDISAIVPDPVTKLSQSHCAVGTIHYENTDPGAPSGTIIYVKASLVGDEPTDVKNYSKECPAFPHESTVDQWFSETQFESYRALGYHTIASSFRAPEAIKPKPIKFELTVGETKVPIEVNLPAVAPGGAAPSLVVSAMPAVDAVPGPGAVPRDPQVWLDAAEDAEKPAYQLVEEALTKFGFDMALLKATPLAAAEAKKNGGH